MFTWAFTLWLLVGTIPALSSSEEQKHKIKSVLLRLSSFHLQTFAGTVINALSTTIRIRLSNPTSIAKPYLEVHFGTEIVTSCRKTHSEDFSRKECSLSSFSALSPLFSIVQLRTIKASSEIGRYGSF